MNLKLREHEEEEGFAPAGAGILRLSAGNGRTPQTASSVYNEVVISAAGDYEPA